MADKIPESDSEFDVCLGNIVNYVDQKTAGDTPAWDHIPPAARAGGD